MESTQLCKKVAYGQACSIVSSLPQDEIEVANKIKNKFDMSTILLLPVHTPYCIRVLGTQTVARQCAISHGYSDS